MHHSITTTHREAHYSTKIINSVNISNISNIRNISDISDNVLTYQGLRTISPVPTRLSARVVGTRRWCMASDTRNSLTLLRSTARPSKPRLKGVRPPPLSCSSCTPIGLLEGAPLHVDMRYEKMFSKRAISEWWLYDILVVL